MCDYSLENVPSRPAAVADRLVTANFADALTRGFAGVGDPYRAVCLRPGTELVFDTPPRYSRAGGFWWKTAPSKVARFRQIDPHIPSVHHDTLEFADGTLVPVARLRPRQCATVLQLPTPQDAEGGVVTVNDPLVLSLG